MSAVVTLTGNGPFTADPSANRPSRFCRDEDAALLASLRLVGLNCRAARRAPPIEACHLFDEDPRMRRATALEKLLRSLPQALGQSPVFFAPGTKTLSFDEAWLMQVIAALRSGDIDSQAFLLRSRVPAHARRAVVFLLRAALEDLPEPARLAVAG